MSGVRVKICGLQRLEDAQAAAAAGADLIGLVFVPGRRRRVEAAAAQEIIAKLRAGSAPAPQVAGLFADQPVEEVNAIIAACGLDYAQLCGQESADYCRQVACQVIKVVHVPEDASGPSALLKLGERVAAYRAAACLVTLDRLVAGLQGGTGQSFDWSLAAELARQGHEFFLAGGLTPENVAQAVAQIRPWGVDVSSGVETAGVKDAAKIRAFVANAHGAMGVIH